MGIFLQISRYKVISPKTPESSKKNLARVGVP
jgi:hypothetical protein